MSHIATLALLATPLIGGLFEAPSQTDRPSAASESKTSAAVQEADASCPLVYEVDPNSVREAGWCRSEASDADAFKCALEVVDRRLAALDDPEGLSVTAGADEAHLVVSRAGSLPPGAWSNLDRCLRSLGLIEFLIVADDEILGGLGTDLRSERRRLEAWSAEMKGASLTAFNALEPEQGGPHPRVVWTPGLSHDPGAAERNERRPIPLLLPRALEDWIGSGHFSRVYPSPDVMGRPAVGFEIEEAFRPHFGAFTSANLHRQLAIVESGSVVSDPFIESRISAGGQISGNPSYTEAQRRDLLAAIRSKAGPLRLVP